MQVCSNEVQNCIYATAEGVFLQVHLEGCKGLSECLPHPSSFFACIGCLLHFTCWKQKTAWEERLKVELRLHIRFLNSLLPCKWNTYKGNTKALSWKRSVSAWKLSDCYFRVTNRGVGKHTLAGTVCIETFQLWQWISKPKKLSIYAKGVFLGSRGLIKQLSIVSCDCFDKHLTKKDNKLLVSSKNRTGWALSKDDS